MADDSNERPQAVKELVFDTGYSESYIYAVKRAAANDTRSTFNCFVGPRALKTDFYRWLQENTWFKKRFAYPSCNFKRSREFRKDANG